MNAKVITGCTRKCRPCGIVVTITHSHWKTKTVTATETEKLVTLACKLFYSISLPHWFGWSEFLHGKAWLYSRPCSCYRAHWKNRGWIVTKIIHRYIWALPFSLCTYKCKFAGAKHPHVPHGMSAALRVTVCSYLWWRTMEIGRNFFHVTHCVCIFPLPSTLSRMSITGCLGSPMMTPVGPALTMSALKNSEFSGMPSSTIVTLKCSRLLPGWKVISKGPLGI